ncbi:methyl-accepting chemotaxis protein [Maritalea porphyrae]|uniref:methyl-accepting chemotaxis protein n=1 Tax=Maritalea porphyrae TaxID=880732 RepID=UPI0022AF391F|nr:methyl-accepting chemotaxis protein [Maritalea porphyrae]MCZ4271985.1 methyl-accepting chemotaxis protein [Maritalea porphyrae]
MLTITGGLLFLILGAGYFYSLVTSASVKTEEQRYAQVDRSANQLKAMVLEMQSVEKNFLLNPTLEMIDQIVVQEALVGEKLAELRSLVDDPQFVTLADTIEGQLEERQTLFKAIGDTSVALGLSAEEGIRGSLRSAVKAAEAELQRANLEVLTIKVLMMRRHEKDFIIRGDAKYVGELDARVSEFQMQINWTPLDEDKKKEISGLISDYQTEFKIFAEKSGELNGIVANLQTLYGLMLPNIDMMLSEADLGVTTAIDNLNAVERNSTIIFSSVIGFALLFMIAAGTIIGRSISGPLNKLANVAEELGQDKLDVDIEADDAHTEIGTLTRALMIFKENAIKVAELGVEEAARQQQIAKRAKMMEDLQASFGEVVGAAAAGDFSKRVNEDIADEEMVKLSRSVNHLITTVDSGLKQTGEVLAALANTDLTKRVEGQFEGAFAQLKNDTNRVADRLNEVVGQLRGTSRALKSATSEILAGANDLSERTTRQAATIEQTSAAMESLAETVLENAKEADHASENATRVKTTAEEGGEVMRKATTAMERITESSGKISNIIGMIDDIAFQTNLLALNASVEAARAGEAGKGFAVVAVEVRRLAQSAAQASSEVKVLIEQSGNEVDGGTKLVAQAAASLEQMLEAANSNNEAMVAIAQKSKSQSNSIEEINMAVREMDETTQHNAALVEETNAAIEQTEAQANELDRIVDVFVTENGGTPRLPVGANNQVPDELPVQTGIKALQEKAMNVAKSFISNGNAAVKADEDWQEF